MEKLREELIDYFCSILPSDVIMVYDEKEVDGILGKHINSKVEVTEIRQTLGLLNSMVLSGEDHSETSKNMVQKSYESLSKLIGV